MVHASTLPKASKHSVHVNSGTLRNTHSHPLIRPPSSSGSDCGVSVDSIDEPNDSIEQLPVYARYDSNIGEKYISSNDNFNSNLSEAEKFSVNVSNNDSESLYRSIKGTEFPNLEFDTNTLIVPPPLNFSSEHLNMSRDESVPSPPPPPFPDDYLLNELLLQSFLENKQDQNENYVLPPTLYSDEQPPILNTSNYEVPFLFQETESRILSLHTNNKERGKYSDVLQVKNEDSLDSPPPVLPSLDATYNKSEYLNTLTNVKQSSSHSIKTTQKYIVNRSNSLLEAPDQTVPSVSDTTLIPHSGSHDTLIDKDNFLPTSSLDTSSSIIEDFNSNVSYPSTVSDLTSEVTGNNKNYLNISSSTQTTNALTSSSSTVTSEVIRHDENTPVEINISSTIKSNPLTTSLSLVPTTIQENFTESNTMYTTATKTYTAEFTKKIKDSSINKNMYITDNVIAPISSEISKLDVTGIAQKDFVSDVLSPTVTQTFTTKITKFIDNSSSTANLINLDSTSQVSEKKSFLLEDVSPGSYQNFTSEASHIDEVTEHGEGSSICQENLVLDSSRPTVSKNIVSEVTTYTDNLLTTNLCTTFVSTNEGFTKSNFKRRSLDVKFIQDDQITKDLDLPSVSNTDDYMPHYTSQVIENQASKLSQKFIYYDDIEEFYAQSPIIENPPDTPPPPIPKTSPPPLPKTPPPPVSKVLPLLLIKSTPAPSSKPPPPPLPATPPPSLSRPVNRNSGLYIAPKDNIVASEPVYSIPFNQQTPSKPPITPRPSSLIYTNLHVATIGIESGKAIDNGNLATKQKPPQSPKSNATKMSVSDKKKFFENAMEESQKPSPKPDKVFSYLSADEVERMKAEEEKKIATLSRAEISSLSALDHSDDESVESQPTRPASTIGVVRTAKAERRLRDRLREEGLLTDEDDYNLSPAEERTLRAEKRAAWRQARLKSLEQDAIQAQMVIKSMTDMVAAGEVPPPATIHEDVTPTKPTELRPSSADFPKLAVRSKPGNTTVRESEKILGETVTRRTEEYIDDATGEKRVRTVEYVEKLIEREVETLQEKIISLELTKTEEGTLEVAVNGSGNVKCAEEDEAESEDPTTPTTGEERSLGEDTSSTTNKKKKRKRSRKGKH